MKEKIGETLVRIGAITQNQVDTILAKQKAGEGADGVSPEVQQRLLKTVEDMAGQNLAKLDELPSDIGGQIRELTDYDFMDDEARQQFQELMDMLKKHAMESYGRDLVQQFKDICAVKPGKWIGMELILKP